MTQIFDGNIIIHVVCTMKRNLTTCTVTFRRKDFPNR